MSELNRIKEVLAKDKKKWTAYRLHKESGITYALISAYLKNQKQPTLETLKKIADAMEVKGKDLINF
jgi:transcriptional regulator with XRE-family HTH domain